MIGARRELQAAAIALLAIGRIMMLIAGEHGGDELRAGDARAALGVLMTGAETRAIAGGAP